MRLQRLRQEYGDKIALQFKSFMLRPEYTPGRKPRPNMAESWQRVQEQAQDVGLQFRPWSSERDLPTHSLPALEAANYAALQGETAFERMHLRLMAAYFTEERDISDRTVLVELAEEAHLDVERFTADLDSGAQRQAVFAEYQEAYEHYGITAIPTAVFNDARAIIGAVPIDQYRALIDRLLQE